MSQSGYVHLEDCDIIRDTDKALLIRYQDEEFWIPISQIAHADTFEPGDEGVTVSITEYIAQQKGIEA